MMAALDPTNPTMGAGLQPRPLNYQPNSNVYNQNSLNNSTLTNLNNLNQGLNAQNTNLQNNYKQAVQTNTGSYQNIMDRYNQMLGGGSSYANGYGATSPTSQVTAPQINAQNQMDPNTIAQF